MRWEPEIQNTVLPHVPSAPLHSTVEPLTVLPHVQQSLKAPLYATPGSTVKTLPATLGSTLIVTQGRVLQGSPATKKENTVGKLKDWGARDRVVAALNALSDREALSVPDLARLAQCRNVNSAHQVLYKLYQLGQVERVGRGQYRLAKREN
jgi:hypothetical protein